MAKKSTKKNNNFDIKRLMDASGSYKNLIYGVITVIVLFVIIFLGVRTLSQNQGDIDEGAVTIDESANQVEFEVSEGDTLWSISEEVYGTGFNWQLIADANNIENPNDVEKGTTLVIPELTPTEEVAMEDDQEEEEAQASPTTAPTEAPEAPEQQQETPSTDTEYAVQAGDSLWKIAVAQYNDGYRWVEIWRANEIENPDIIHPGQRLAIPR